MEKVLGYTPNSSMLKLVLNFLSYYTTMFDAIFFFFLAERIHYIIGGFD